MVANETDLKAQVEALKVLLLNFRIPSEKVTRKNLEKILEILKRRKEVIELARDKIQKSGETLTKNLIVPRVREIQYADLKKILLKNANEALSSLGSDEYNIPEWREQLVSSLDKNFDAIVHIKGFDYENVSLEPRVKIEPERALGSGQDYGNIVTAVRLLMQYGPNFASKYTPEIASRAWKYTYKVAREGLVRTRSNRYVTLDADSSKPVTLKKATEKAKIFYWAVMQSRLDEMGDKAPFWYILEHGNPNLKMPSDQGGTAYPKVYPTRFIRKSEMEMTLKIKPLVSSISNIEGSLEQLLITIRENVLKEENIKQAISETEKLITLYEQSEAFPNEQVTERFITKTAEVSNRVLARVPQTDTIAGVSIEKMRLKVEFLLSSLIAGEVSAGKRLYIGTLAGKELRIRTVQLTKELLSTFNDLKKSSKEFEKTLASVFLEVSKVKKRDLETKKAKKTKKVGKVK